MSFHSFGRSMVERGVAVGVALAAKKPPGIKFQNVDSYASQPGNEKVHSVNTMSNIPIFSYFSKKSILGGQFGLHFVPPPFSFEKGKRDVFNKHDVHNKKWEGGSFNPFGMAGITWDLPYGWGFSNSAGGFIPWHGSKYSYQGS